MPPSMPATVPGRRRRTEAKPPAIDARRLAVEKAMKLIAYYLVLTSIASTIAAGLCLAIEEVAPWISMPIFLVLFFVILWAAWIAAVRLTEPKAVATTAAGSTSGQRA
jgi:uncharacterized membrane protein